MEKKNYFRKESTSLGEANGNKRIWHPKIEHRMHREYYTSSDELLYVATPIDANIQSLQASDLLYVGCSLKGGQRFWRGKQDQKNRFPKPKSCFHHEQMRRGRDDCSLESRMSSGSSVTVHTMTSNDVLKLMEEHQMTLPPGKYPAHQLEVKILAEGFRNWQWNRKK